jgi:hypothetical protein
MQLKEKSVPMRAVEGCHNPAMQAGTPGSI